MTNKINSSAKPASFNFKAIKVAKTQSFTNGIKTEIDIYRLTQKDCPFLQNLAQIVEPEKLMPKYAQKSGFEGWREILLYATQNAMSNDFRSYLAAAENKPCGLINFRTINKITHVESICTWPIKINEKVKFAGKILFNQVLDYHKKLNSDKITLNAINNGCIQPLKRYIDLGFVKTEKLYNTIKMEMTKENAQKLQKEFEGYFTCIPVETGQEFNLCKTLNLDF